MIHAMQNVHNGHGWAEDRARRLEFHPGFLPRWQGPNDWSLPCRLSGFHVSRKLEPEVGTGPSFFMARLNGPWLFQPLLPPGTTLTSSDAG